MKAKTAYYQRDVDALVGSPWANRKGDALDIADV